MKMNNKAIAAIRESKGRFFGLTTKHGTHNARLVRETNNYITFVDRNSGAEHKVAKTSVKNVRIAGQVV
tara:strand:- start:5600 stop:5806 length:207 start_codon:yes stop_codon:yes gene_type:complete